MSDTIFSKIIKGEIHSFKIYEDAEFLAFLDIFPATEGHTLVIPKKEYEFVWDMPTDLLQKYWTIIHKIANHYRNTVGYKYVDTLILGRDVPHVHVHLIPHDNQSLTKWRDVLNTMNEHIHNDSNKLSAVKGKEVSEKLKLYEG